MSIFGELDSCYQKKLKENYVILDSGYNSFPVMIPGTRYFNSTMVRLMTHALCSYHLNLIMRSINSTTHSFRPIIFALVFFFGKFQNITLFTIVDTKSLLFSQK